MASLHELKSELKKKIIMKVIKPRPYMNLTVKSMDYY